MAPVLYQTLLQAKAAVRQGESVRSVEKTAATVLTLLGFRVQYFAVVNAVTLRPASGLKKGANVAIVAAAFLGKTRLIDNAVLSIH